jgi:hypothetical protein
MTEVWVVDTCGSEHCPPEPTIEVYEVDDSEYQVLEKATEEVNGDYLYTFLPLLKKIAKPKKVIKPDVIITV